MNNLFTGLFEYIDSLYIKSTIYFFYIMNVTVISNIFFKMIVFDSKEIDWKIKSKKEFSIFIFTLISFVGLIFTSIPLYFSSSLSLWSSVYFFDASKLYNQVSQQSENLMILTNILLFIFIVVMNWLVLFKKKGTFILDYTQRTFSNTIESSDRLGVALLKQVRKNITLPFTLVYILDSLVKKARESIDAILDTLSDYCSFRNINSLNGLLLVIVLCLIMIMFSVLRGI